MGNSNTIIDRKLDYKSKEERKGPRRILPKAFFKMVDELGMRDIWRERNQEGSQYTYYSSRYKTWSRIDMVWVSTELSQVMGEVEIETNLWADHNQVRIRWRGGKKIGRWTLKRAIIKHKEFKIKLEEQLKLFFQENKKEDTNIQNLWDTTKAYVRGVAIAYMARENKKKKQKGKNLEEEFQRLEIELQHNPQNESLKQQMEVIKHKLSILEK